MHGEETHLARCPRLDREVRAPAHVVLGQAQGTIVAVAAEFQAAPDRESDVLNVRALREAEFAVRKNRPRRRHAVDLLERDHVRGQLRSKLAHAADVLVAPARLRNEIAGYGTLVATRPVPGLAAGRRKRVEGRRRHHPFEVPGRERELRGGVGGGGNRECERRAEQSCHLSAWRRFATRSVTTAGSASVDVSPRCSCSLAAILRRIRRMIFPERVLGSPGAHWM